MRITPGKQKGLKAVSDSRGVIAAAAMDQRGSLKSAIAKERGVDKSAVTPQMLEEFKIAVTRVLTPHASAILLDPEYGLPAARARSSNAGLLLAYENSGYDNTRPGRLPDLLDIWSVRRLVGAGADCIKILLYYTPFDSHEINDIKHAWVERIGAECAGWAVKGHRCTRLPDQERIAPKLWFSRFDRYTCCDICRECISCVSIWPLRVTMIGFPEMQYEENPGVGLCFQN